MVLKKANQWLKKHTEYKLKKVQSVDVAVPYTSLNLNANTAATDYYIDQGSKFYSRSLRLVTIPKLSFHAIYKVGNTTIFVLLKFENMLDII